MRVDVIFRITNHIYLDAPMERRARRRELVGTHVWVASPEDQIVITVMVDGRDAGDRLG